MNNKKANDVAIAFLGVGQMGTPMASRLISAGFHVRVWNRSKGRVKGLVQLGGTEASTPAAAAAGACPVSPWIAESPGMPGVAAGAAGAAAAGVSPGMDGIAAGAEAGAAAPAGVSPGNVMPGAAGAAGGVAPRAVARFCRICGALAAEAINCCGMFCNGPVRSGAGSAWAIPPVKRAADEPTTTAVARK